MRLHDLRRRIARRRQRDGEDRELVGGEAQVGVLQRVEAAQQETGAEQQHERQPDFRGRGAAIAPARTGRRRSRLAARAPAPAARARAAARDQGRRAPSSRTRAPIANDNVGTSKRTSSRRGRLAGANAFRRSSPHHVDSETQPAAGDGQHQVLGQQVAHHACGVRRRARCAPQSRCCRARRAPAPGWRRSRTRSAAPSPRRRAARRARVARCRPCGRAASAPSPSVSKLALGNCCSSAAAMAAISCCAAIGAAAVGEPSDAVQVDAAAPALLLVVAHGQPQTRARSGNRSRAARHRQSATARR